MRMRWLARLLLPFLQHWAWTRPHPETRVPGQPDFQVTNGAAGKAVYLRRWHIVRPRWWRPGLYLHQILLDDEAVQHDHPYASLSFCLSDGLRERYSLRPWETHMLPQYGEDDPNAERLPKAGDWVYRSSTLSHQLIVLPGSDPWTLFFTGPRLKKEWGFWCPKGFVHFRKYSSRPDIKAGYGGTGESGVGRGCGEMS